MRELELGWTDVGRVVSVSVLTLVSRTSLIVTRLTLPDLTPNPGLWWYFFTEMFDHFRPFFLMVFSVRLMPFDCAIT